MRTASRIVLGILLMRGIIELAAGDELKSVVNALKSADAQTRMMAIQRLGESGDIRAVQPLLAALHDENTLVRTYAIEALQRLVSILDDIHGVVKRWLQTLIKSLKNAPSEEVTAMAQPAACARAGHGRAFDSPAREGGLSS